MALNSKESDLENTYSTTVIYYFEKELSKLRAKIKWIGRGFMPLNRERKSFQ